MVFVADYATADHVSTGGGVTDEHENIDVLELALDDAIELVHQGEIRDGKTVLLLLWAQRAART